MNKKYRDNEVIGITEFKGVKYAMVYKEKENQVVYEKLSTRPDVKEEDYK